LTLVFGPISYGEVNLRVANLIVGLIPIFGWPSIIGQTMGVLITATVSPLGPLDFVNVLPAFLFSWLIWKLRKISVFVGLVSYSLALGVSVSLTLYFVSKVPFLVVIPYVTTGILLMTAGFGYLLYRTVEKADVIRWISVEPLDSDNNEHRSSHSSRN
jgi:uncharacterized membrane protein